MLAKIEYADRLARSGLLPDQYKGHPENLLWAIEYAAMLDLPPMAAITGIHVIKGKPSASGALISALVRKAGHRLRVGGTTTEGTCDIIRKDDPDFKFTVTWTMDMARNAGLLSNDNWKKYPRSMLKWRALTECARDACPEALFGILYTPEELGAEVNEDGSIVVTQAPTRAQAPRTVAGAVEQRSNGATATEAPRSMEPPADLDWAALAEDATTKAEVAALWRQAGEAGALTDEVKDVLTARATAVQISPTQLKALHALFDKAGYGDRDLGLAYLTDLLGRDVDSSKTLTRVEADRAIDALRQEIVDRETQSGGDAAEPGSLPADVDASGGNDGGEPPGWEPKP